MFAGWDIIRSFEQIKEYVKGDDYRTINWKASARRHELMVNVYQDERSQQIYNVIDKGRVMQQAFRGMTCWIMRLMLRWCFRMLPCEKKTKPDW